MAAGLCQVGRLAAPCISRSLTGAGTDRPRAGVRAHAGAGPSRQTDGETGEFPFGSR